jgi:hypothetical protein
MSDSNHNEQRGVPADVISFVDKFKSQKELQEYAKAQFVTLLQANKKIKELEKENTALKTAIQQQQMLAPATDRIVKSAEEITCELEIEKLQQAAMMRELDLNETRKLEILVKTLYTARAKTLESLEAQSRKVDQIDQAELIKIASTAEPKE